MVAYSIKDLESLSGVKAHTLRIWEKRYGIIKPSRTDTNIRYYMDCDLQKILNITLLNRKGYKISKIAGMPNDEIRQKVAELTEVGAVFEDQLDAMMLSMFELDETKFNIMLDHHISSKGFEETMNDVVYPLLDKLSVMWIAGSVKGVHENFVSNIIRRKTIVEIDKLNKNESIPGFKCLIFLPENESHELSLLFLQYILVKNRAKVINLGTGVPLIDVLEGKNIFNAKYIFTIFNDSFSEAPLQPYINELSKNAQETTILISGFQTASQQLNLPSNVQILNSIDQIKSFIRKETTSIN
ncbi:MAG: MerR family transcriptional regulator [Saprospiraceae bacterium]|jgi:DNA-binding transcriptional MerR regulator|nr:MerR family transcriptional regulator [Saprospiraceae bacterium]MBP6565582.1 MerR family transcriptional regulator [Saprospiraceae bacterium]MBP9196577.1 MerR family transcriptional regulator [Saprospiraceae bacterium]